MAQPSLSLLERLVFSPSILDLIAFYVAIDPFLGPPSNLVPLLLTSRTLYNHLSVKHNSHLYASIFHHKFDFNAVQRRLSSRWTSDPCLAEELRTRFVVLSYIRRGGVALHVDTYPLWRAYLMMLENDGRNEQQLCNWANLPRWLLAAVSLRCLYLPAVGASDLPLDLEGTSLALWLLWMTINEEHLREEASLTRKMVIQSAVPFIIRGYQYPSVFAPDSHFYLPLCENQDEATLGFSGPSPKVRTLRHYGHQIRLAVPPPTPVALLNYLVRREAHQNNVPLPPQTADLPATRQEAIARGAPRPSLTHEDVIEFHSVRTHFFQQHSENGSSPSEQLDREWFRLVSCHNLWDIERPLRGIMYSLGTLSGDWRGRMLVPDIQPYMTAVMDTNVRSATVVLMQEYLSCRFEEHHCLKFQEPLAAPPCPSGLGGEDVSTAWLPRHMRVVRTTNGLRIFDLSTGKDACYETYHPDRVQPYSDVACQRLNEMDRRSPTPPNSTQYDTNVTDEYEDYVEERGSGVQDIIITGETSERQGDAWGAYTYIGRVRRWDGLVVLLRIPLNDPVSARLRLIFKGYVHGRSLVGRWRDTGTAGLGSGFVLCQQDAL